MHLKAGPEISFVWEKVIRVIWINGNQGNSNRNPQTNIIK